jgi:inhibitor of KinA
VRRRIVTDAMRIQPVGDSALRVALGETIDEPTLERVRRAHRALANARLPGVVELVPAYATVTAYYDVEAAVGAGAPADEVATWIANAMRAALARETTASAMPLRTVEVPVRYGGEYGPDLEAVAAHAGVSADEVAAQHAQASYRVAMIGFAPGFPYLVGLPKTLAMPRLATPRLRVPSGSVGIAGEQTGIYPLATPGGWRLIGRTPLTLFRPDLDPPTLLLAGDAVVFRAITDAEYEAHVAGEAAVGPPMSDGPTADLR